MEDRLRFHPNERVKRVQEIRKRNRRKRRVWLGILLVLVLSLGTALVDRAGFFELFFSTKVSYAGPTEYQNLKSETGEVRRADIVTMAQLLVNHPYAFGQQELTLGIPEGPLDAAGFVDWVYYNLTGKALSAESPGTGPLTSRLWDSSEPVLEEELKVGDLGFTQLPESTKVNHVGIYIGEIHGKKAFIHAGGIDFAAEGLENGRIVISLNNTLRRNNQDLQGNKFSPSAESTQFVYYRRPTITIVD